MACAASIPPDSISVNVDIRRTSGGLFMEHIDVAVIGGGQSGLATAHALLREGLRPVVLEASERSVGSWPATTTASRSSHPRATAHCPGCRSPTVTRTAIRTGTR
ncbi:FAD-dependent oxidoreductase [Streptomyces sp. NPDC024017]|uniref:FAD-dependent oxidoreductase n=1 Tax=Streptomyces sp. NPDC024017 TaxID=3154326 RepID=UPI0033EB89BF